MVALTLDTIVHTWLQGVGNRYSSSLGKINPIPIQVSASNWYIIIYGDNPSGTNRLYWVKTTDSGVTWTAPADIENTDRVGSYAVWYDPWTNGDSGTLIHIFAYDVTVGTRGEYYYNLDTSDDSISSPVTIDTTVFANDGSLNCSITKARGGNLYASINATVGIAKFYRSTDAGLNWTSQPVPESVANDIQLLQPGNETDNQDIWSIYYDVTATELSLYTWDNSLTSWSETSISTGITLTGYIRDYYHFAVAPRHSDDHSILVAWNALNVSTADLLAWDIGGSSSIVALTNVETNLDGSYFVSVTVDQNNDDIYVVSITSPLSTLVTRVPVEYRLSTDDGTVWGSKVAVNNGLNNDVETVWTCPSINNFGVPHVVWTFGARYQLMCDVSITDNVGAALSFAAGTIPVVEDTAYRLSAPAVNSQTVERPRGCTEGDLLLLLISSTFTGTTHNLDTPTGWTVLAERIGSGDFTANMVAWKFVVADEAATFTITSTGGGVISNVAILRISNPHPIDPIGAEEYEQSSASGKPDVPAITTTVNNSLVVRGGVTSSGAFTIPALHTYIYDVNQGTNGGSVGVGSIDAPVIATFAQELTMLDGLLPVGIGFSLEILGSSPLISLAVCLGMEFNYQPFFGGASFDIDICLKVDTWKTVIDTGANVIPTAGVTGTAITISTIEYLIQLDGTISGPHKEHPDSDPRHNPDLQDIEEIAILINRAGLENKAELTLTLPDGDLIYHGVVKQVTLEQGAGLPVQGFSLVFQVLWTVSKPAWRGWI